MSKILLTVGFFVPAHDNFRRSSVLQYNMVVCYSCQFIFGSRLEVVILNVGRLAVVSYNGCLLYVAFTDAFLFFITGFQ